MADKDKSKNRRKIRLNYYAALILLFHSLFFMIYWIAVGNFRGDVDRYIGSAIDRPLPYTTLLMIFTGLIVIWSLTRFVKLHLAFRKGKWQPSFGNWAYSVIWMIFLGIFYASFGIILEENPSQRGVLFHLLNLTRLGGDALVFLILGIWLRRLIVYFRRKMQTAKRQIPWAIGIMIVLICLIGLWLFPMLFPPNWAYQGDLPAKPALLAHRGASMLAPENTLAAAELAADHQAFGFETDVRISLDGVPFLMHDETLERTTNVAEVFPDRAGDRASSFTLEELEQLNAGLWFIQKDPFGTIADGLVSQMQLGINQGQGIPTLSEALDLVDSEGLVILFDLRYPPPDHPYFDDFFDIVLTQCRESGLNGDIWFLANRDRIQIVLDQAPQLTRVIGASSTDLPDPEKLIELEYEIVNVDTGIPTQSIQVYREKGLGVNVYTIDQGWLFSQFWLSGVTSVTTNNVHAFNQMKQPFLNIPYSRYLLFWGLFGIIVAIWLAGSQPERESDRPRQMVTPDLMDFAVEDDQNTDLSASPSSPMEIEEGKSLDQTQEESESS